MEEKVIGEYLGFDLAILKDALGAKKIALKGESDYDTEISTSAVGLIVRLENLFEGISEKQTFLEKKISDYERDMESSKEQYERPFEYEEELNQKKTMYQNLKCEVLHAVSSLTRLQRQLICGYYVHGHSWDTVNRICGVKRQQSIYQVRKAFDKILERA